MTDICDLNDRDLRVIQKCLKAAVDGPFFPDWEFQAMFGFKRFELATIAVEWPMVSSYPKKEVSNAIVGSLLNLTGYPHREEEAWDRYISVPSVEVAELLDRWLKKQTLLDEVPRTTGEIFPEIPCKTRK